MSPRKRKRQLSSPEPEPEENEVVNDGLPNNDQLENEREIWEAFREEHFEGELLLRAGDSSTRMLFVPCSY